MELEDLINSIDIVEYISQFVDLEKKGDEYWGLSPFKDEKTPSFSVRKETGKFYDYSSGIGGNVFTFVRFYNKCGNSDAVNILSKFAGVQDDTVTRRKKIEALRVCKKFVKNDTDKKKPDAGVVLPNDCMSRYEVRDDKLVVWENEGISRSSIRRFDVRYDSFSNRLVYPIKDIDGKIVNIGGRTLDPDFKNKKIRKYTYLYHWGTMNIIYGLFDNINEIRKRKEIILFEGCKSVLLADTYGFGNAGAILTSHLNPNQMKVLIGLGCRVVFALDKDVDIKNDHNIQKLKHFVTVEVIQDVSNCIDEKDSPTDKGEEIFRKLYNDRKRL